MSKQTLDPITGPLSREEFARLILAPFGEATKVIRRYDPLWAREPGEKFPWIVQVQRTGRDTGHAEIMAGSEEEADKKADWLDDDDIEWDYDSPSFEIVSIKPKTAKGSDPC